MCCVRSLHQCPFPAARPWTHSPTTFSNAFFTELLSESWIPERNPKGNMQYYNPKKDLMMLPADMAIREDPEFAAWAQVRIFFARQ